MAYIALRASTSPGGHWSTITVVHVMESTQQVRLCRMFDECLSSPRWFPTYNDLAWWD